MSGDIIDNYCGSPPSFDETFIYYQGGPSRDQLWRRRKDLSEPPQFIHIHCGGTPAVDSEWVYFLGGPKKDQMLRKYKDGRLKDGHDSLQYIDYDCGGAPIIDEHYVYYQTKKQQLVRKLKDGSGAVEFIDEHCVFPPIIDGDYIYIVGGPTGAFLYRKRKNGLSVEERIGMTCQSQPYIDGDLLYYVNGTNPMNGFLYRQYKDGRLLSSGNTKIDPRVSASMPLIYKNFVLYQSSMDKNQLSAKHKDGVGMMYRVADYCGTSPKYDDGYIYYLTSSTYYVLARVPVPYYLEE
jgi:hypothetical protein